MGDVPEMVRITKVGEENRYYKTYFLSKKLDAQPGQFIMVWIPGVDEKQFSLSYIGDEITITVEAKGVFTKRLFEMKEGDMVGVRGPYGRGFPIVHGKTCVVAGGCGVAPLLPLIDKLEDPVVILGARSRDRMMFLNRIKNPIITTDDGSLGRKGFATDVLGEVLEKGNVSAVYTCGPEIMMKKAFDICEEFNVHCLASLERFMKCGFGVCGQCEINGFRVCRDGPVFSSEQLRKMKDLGHSARLKSGKKVSLKEYYSWRSKP